jgi:hypothetical protein
MHSGRAQFEREIAVNRTLDPATGSSSAHASRSDSILEDIRVPNTRFAQGDVKREADLRGSSIPCLPAPYETEHFPFWNQPIAAGVQRGSRQLKFIGVRPEQDGLGMATLSSNCASLLYGTFSGLLQTQVAVSMANPEV